MGEWKRVDVGESIFRNAVDFEDEEEWVKLTDIKVNAKKSKDDDAQIVKLDETMTQSPSKVSKGPKKYQRADSQKIEAPKGGNKREDVDVQPAVEEEQWENVMNLIMHEKIEPKAKPQPKKVDEECKTIGNSERKSNEGKEAVSIVGTNRVDAKFDDGLVEIAKETKAETASLVDRTIITGTAERSEIEVSQGVRESAVDQPVEPVEGTERVVTLDEGEIENAAEDEAEDDE